MTTYFVQLPFMVLVLMAVVRAVAASSSSSSFKIKTTHIVQLPFILLLENIKARPDLNLHNLNPFILLLTSCSFLSYSARSKLLLKLRSNHLSKHSFDQITHIVQLSFIFRQAHLPELPPVCLRVWGQGLIFRVQGLRLGA